MTSNLNLWPKLIPLNRIKITMMMMMMMMTIMKFQASFRRFKTLPTIDHSKEASGH